MQIKIIGVGCPACQQLEIEIRQWLTHNHVEAQVERIDDLVEILNYRLLALPGLVIDERIVMMGYHHAQLDQVLRAATERSAGQTDGAQRSQVVGT